MRLWIVVASLLIPIAILAYAKLVRTVVHFADLAPVDNIAELPTWSLGAHILLFWVWGVSLAVTVLSYYQRSRS